MRRALEREPVRVYLYSLTVALVAALVAFGVVDGDKATVVLGVAAAALSVPAVEAARSQVTPTADRKRRAKRAPAAASRRRRARRKSA